MRKIRIVVSSACLFLSSIAWAQHRPSFISVSVTNHHSAYPFSDFASLFTKGFHPGFELGYRFNWRTKPKHDWYQTFNVGYFYHRFVQHAIPVYTQIGYRYKALPHLQISAALGAGYLHSVPATAVLKLNSDGMYKNAKGIGRGQAMLAVSESIQYTITKRKAALTAIFITYQQMLQTPFIKSYVPLLPYNSIALGVAYTLK